MSRNPKFDDTLKNIQKIHDAKNSDYSADDNPYSNFEITAAIAGVDLDTVFLTQIGNKIARLQELLKGKTPNFESIEDTRLDLATYCCLYASYFTNYSTSPTSSSIKKDRRRRNKN